jgi:hypothetical protein
MEFGILPFAEPLFHRVLDKRIASDGGNVSIVPPSANIFGREGKHINSLVGIGA